VAGRGVLMEKRDVFRIKKLFKTNQAQAKQIVLFAEKVFWHECCYISSEKCFHNYLPERSAAGIGNGSRFPPARRIGTKPNSKIFYTFTFA
jgi:hypothetical protein